MAGSLEEKDKGAFILNHQYFKRGFYVDSPVLKYWSHIQNFSSTLQPNKTPLQDRFWLPVFNLCSELSISMVLD